MQQRQAESFRAGNTPFGQCCSGVEETRRVSSHSAERAAHGIRYPSANYNLAERSALRYRLIQRRPDIRTRFDLDVASKAFAGSNRKRRVA